MRSNQTSLPLWMAFVVAITFVITGVIVGTFAVLSLDAYFNRPLNPLAEAAEAVSDIELEPLPQNGLAPPPTVLANLPLASPIATTEAAAETERINVLVMGIDRRPGGSFISRTDTMMLMSIDPEDNSASILSIPRDLYVVLPGRGRERINTALVYGSGGDNPAAGAQLAMQTVEYNLGVPVDHYLMVDFGAVVRGIDTIGGIDVNVPYNINDPTYPDMNFGYDPLFIPAGLQHFDGVTALKYARTRHQDNDFYRGRRQQHIVMAVRSKVLALGFDDLLSRAPQLYDRVDEGIRTDLSMNDIISLLKVAASISEENIRNEVLDENYVSSYRTEAGASVLVPINENIEPLIKEMFYD